ncbi:hypothetical protein JAAARDRAFT_56998 [Jaapia argillacea MUCL 33604]|uniref:Aminotransferase class I/classII large domain-containing protein n=1 Tax=Jaapia argillacea MUCL 33604 TaxID=933084 RepID=A0A067PW23_9AGAM|nr:hypothetical protein JAAARDRAFT_56998 [Jaapia argillacea MUCL 33604]
MSALKSKLNATLKSREDRRILRKLPSPTSQSAWIDFSSNDYLSLSSSPALRDHFLPKLSSAPQILGSGGSRLLVNGLAHHELEERLKVFFGVEAALLFNSGFDANVGLFECVPQTGDVLIFDEYIHASVHDGMKRSRVSQDSRFSFSHNDLSSLHGLLEGLSKERPGLKKGLNTVFVAVESLYSMDGTFAPLPEIVALLEKIFPKGNAFLIVDEAHATGIYGPQGKGLVAHFGLQGHDRVLARLCTFGKALAGTGAVVLTHKLIRDYLINYARPLIYTTSLSFANIVAVNCSFDFLENGRAQQLSSDLLSISAYFLKHLTHRLSHTPPSLVALPCHLLAPSSPPSPSSPSPSPSATSTITLVPPIIPLLTPHPHALASHLQNMDLNVRPITWPTVPKGKERVRICLHSGNGRDDIEKLVDGVVQWAGAWMKKEQQSTAKLGVGMPDDGVGNGLVSLAVPTERLVLLESKL